MNGSLRQAERFKFTESNKRCRLSVSKSGADTAPRLIPPGDQLLNPHFLD
jgi:hypothetical protein